MLLNCSAAFEYVKKLLRAKGYAIRMLSYKSNGRHLIIEGIDSKEHYQYFYCIYKHEFIHSFNELFPEFVSKHTEYAGYAESINIEYLEYARVREAILLYIYPDCKVYSIDSNFLNNFVIEHGLLREQTKQNEYDVAYGNGLTEVVHEKVNMFPIKLLNRYN